MSERWSRRAVLAGLGATAAAGCLTTRDGDSGATPTDAPTGTASETPPTRGTAPPPTNDPETDTATDGSETDTATDGSETDTATDGSTPADSAPEPPSNVESDWLVPDADAGRSNYAPDAAGPTDPVSELWRVPVDAGLSVPVLAEGTLYVGGDDGVARAFDARTGERRWRASVGGPAGSPWFVEGRLFVPTERAVVALDSNDGTEVWRAETPNRQGVLVAAHGVYWVDADGPTVVSHSRAGEERWRTDIADPWEPRVFADETRVFVSSGPHDNRFWRLAADTGEQLNEDPRRGADFPAEKFHRDGTVYALDGFFGTVDAKPVAEGGRDWRHGVPGGGDDLVGGGDRVYHATNVDGEPDVTALSVTDGEVAWETDLEGTVGSRPVVAAEGVFVPTDGGLACLDPSDGAERWTADVDAGSGFLVADDLVYAAGNGALTAYRPP